MGSIISKEIIIDNETFSVCFSQKESQKSINDVMRAISGKLSNSEVYKLLNEKIQASDKCCYKRGDDGAKCTKGVVDKRIVELTHSAYHYVKCQSSHYSIMRTTRIASILNDETQVLSMYESMNKTLFNSTQEHNYIEREFKGSFNKHGKVLRKNEIIDNISILILGETKQENIRVVVLNGEISIKGSDFNRELINFLSNEHLLVPLWLSMYAHSINYPLALSLVKAFITHSINECARLMQLKGDDKVTGLDINVGVLGDIGEFYSGVFSVKKITQIMKKQKFEQLKKHTRGDQKHRVSRKAMQYVITNDISIHELFAIFDLDCFTSVIDIIKKMDKSGSITCLFSRWFITLLGTSDRKFTRELKRLAKDSGFEVRA